MDNHSLRILVVDDNPLLRRLLVELIEQSGNQPMAAYDGGDGLIKAREFSPDMVITNCLMPIMDGIDLARALRSHPGKQQPYIILSMGQEDEHRLTEAFQAGIDDFISKPLKTGEITARLSLGQRILHLQRQNTHQTFELQRYSEELDRSNLRFRTQAVTDELTGLPNRRYALERLQQEWAASNRHCSPLSCLLVDIDGLKQMNKAYGYERGDVLLKTIAAIMKKLFRIQDAVCRVGGDEFLVICPNSPLESAMVCAERLVRAVGSFGIHAEGCPFGLSIGTAERRPDIDHPQSLLDLAERSTLQAKRHGKNQIYSAQEKSLRAIQGLSDTCQLCRLKGRTGKGRDCLWQSADLLEDCIVAA